MIEGALRWTAIAIAVAALVDPSVALSGRVRPRVAIASTAGAASNLLRDRLADDLRGDYEILDGADAGAAATVVIGDRYPDIGVSSNALVSTVTLTAPASRNVRVAAFQAPPRAPLHTAMPVEVDVDAVGAGGATSTVTISSGGVEVGRTSHVWRGDAERWRAALDVVPVGDPPFVLRAQVEALPAERVTADNVAAVLVEAAPAPLRVIAYEPRPSWASTFVRRALEHDARFAVSSVTETSRGIAVRTGEAVSLASADDLEKADVILVGGLDRLEAADVRTLTRFMRDRGGSVVLLPDGRVDAGPARGLVPAPAPTEAFTDSHAPLTMAARLPRIDASEMLVFRDTPAQAAVFARAGGSNAPVIIVVQQGDGRLMFSGALDAWRSRAESGVEFDRFWQAAIAGLALAMPPLVDVDIVPSLPAAGDRVRVSVRARGGAGTVLATLDGTEVVRLWPGAESGVFTGTFAAPAARGVHTVEVTADGVKREIGRGRFVVGAEAASIAPAAPLALLAASHGGINVGASDLAALERHLRATIVPSRAAVRYRAMRSPWWLLPFAVCLNAEWWMRRRRGRR